MSSLADVLDALEVAGARLADVDLRLAAVALAFQLGNLVLRALAWRNVLAAAYPDRRVPILSVGAAYAAGVGLNAYVPARAGEALKIALVRMRLPGSSVATIAASSTVLVLFDLVLGLVLVLAAAAAGMLPAPDVPASAPLLAAAAIALAAVLALVARQARGRLSRLRGQLAQGGSILRTPALYLRRVAAVQAAAWACRGAVVYFLLLAFGLPATPAVAALVVIASGLSTVVPLTPGGVGTQQALLVLVLHETVSTASALSFSVGMQVAITTANTLVALAALMLLFRTLTPTTALRAARAARRRP